MLSVDPILERTFFRSGVGAFMGRGVRGARGTGGFFSIGVCLGTGGLVMTRRRCEFSPFVEAAGVDGVAVGAGRRAAERKSHLSNIYLSNAAGPLKSLILKYNTVFIVQLRQADTVWRKP